MKLDARSVEELATRDLSEEAEYEREMLLNQKKSDHSGIRPLDFDHDIYAPLEDGDDYN